MTWDDDPRIHQVSCSLVSGPEGSDDYRAADGKAEKIAAYARRLGFAVIHDNVDRLTDGEC